MSSDLEQLYKSLVIGRVPENWMNYSYLSLKPLGGYVADLLQRYILLIYLYLNTLLNWWKLWFSRLKFLQDWLDNGIPEIFWISGFYFAQSFLSGVLQNCSRKNQIPINKLGFEFDVTIYEPEIGLMCKPEWRVFCQVLQRNIFEKSILVYCNWVILTYQPMIN